MVDEETLSLVATWDSTWGLQRPNEGDIILSVSGVMFEELSKLNSSLGGSGARRSCDRARYYGNAIVGGDSLQSDPVSTPGPPRLSQAVFNAVPRSRWPGMSL
jgi:hypothetical protein